MSVTVLVLEGIVAVVFLIAVVTCYKRGLLSSIISLFGYVIACIGAYIGSKALAETVYRLFIHERLILKVKEALVNAVPGALVEDYTAAAEFSGEKLLGVLPESLRKFAAKWAEGFSLSEHLSGDLMSTSEGIVETAIYPVILMLLEAMLFFLLFIALLIVVKIAVKFFTVTNKIPVIGGINALLGAVVGAVEAVVIMLLLTTFLKTLFAAGMEISFLTEADIEKTTLFSAFYYRDYLGLLEKLPL